MNDASNPTTPARSNPLRSDSRRRRNSRDTTTSAAVTASAGAGAAAAAEEEEEEEEDHSAQDDDVSPGPRASTRQRRRRRRRQRPSLSQKAKEGLAQKLRFLSHLVYTLDTLVHAELCALYYMEYGIPPFLATKIQTRPAPLTLSLPLLSLAVS